MTYGEAWRLLHRLAVDPSSHFTASLNNWAHPLTHEALVLMDLFDLQHRSKTKKTPRPYPRPWTARTIRRTAPDARLTQEEIVAALRAAGHTAPLPTR